MNWAAWGPTAVAVLAAVFTYGKFAQKQSEHDKRLDGHDDRIEKHASHLSKIDLALVRLEEYNRGFADATRLGTKQ